MSLKLLARQGLAYGLVGVLALVVDWGCFVLLTWSGMDTLPANLFGRVTGAGIAYLLNGVLTFRDQQGSRLGWHRFARFSAVWILLTATSTLAMQAIVHALGCSGRGWRNRWWRWRSLRSVSSRIGTGSTNEKGAMTAPFSHRCCPVFSPAPLPAPAGS